MTGGICIIPECVLNGVNYSCHPVCCRTVRSFKSSGVGLVGGRNCPVNEKVTGPRPTTLYVCITAEQDIKCVLAARVRGRIQPARRIMMRIVQRKLPHYLNVFHSMS